MIWINDPVKDIVGSSGETSAFCLIHKECKCVGSGEALTKQKGKEKVKKEKKKTKTKKKKK